MKRLIATGLHRLLTRYQRLTKPLTLGVGCIVERSDGGVLLVRHTYIPGWHLPAGGVKRGETLEAAIERELGEEVGVVPREPFTLFHAYSNLRPHKSDHIVLFSLRQYDMNPKPNFEIAEHGFFDPADLPSLTGAPTRRRLMEWRGLAPLANKW